VAILVIARRRATVASRTFWGFIHASEIRFQASYKLHMVGPQLRQNAYFFGVWHNWQSVGRRYSFSNSQGADFYVSGWKHLYPRLLRLQ